MEFWNKKVNVSKEAAQKQIAIIRNFSAQKRFKIALNFANMGISQTREWIKGMHPSYSDLEVQLEYVRLMYYEKGEMDKKEWEHYHKKMIKRIRKSAICSASKHAHSASRPRHACAHYARLTGPVKSESTAEPQNINLPVGERSHLPYFNRMAREHVI